LIITIARRQVRCLRGVFRRSVLSISHRGIIPSLALRAEGTQLPAQYRYAPVIAVEHIEPSVFGFDETIALPLDALADFEGSDASHVILEAAAPDPTASGGTTAASRRSSYTTYQRRPPRRLSSDYPDPESRSRLAGSTLIEAGKMGVYRGTRYALNCLQLSGEPHQIIATDGRQLLVSGGFRFPWTDDVLIRISPVFGSKELPRNRPVKLSKTGTLEIFRVRPWTLFSLIQTHVRYPRVQKAIPSDEAATTQLTVGKSDAAFAGDAAKRLPGADEQFSPATLDCHGPIAIRA
jgi:hypothetical protein